MTAIVLDTETTGLDTQIDRVTEIAIVRFESDNDKSSDEGETLFHSYINPGCAISPSITELTGITDDAVKDAPRFAMIAERVASIISDADAIIGQGPHFDRAILQAEFARADVICKWPVLVCTRRLWNLHEPPEQRHLQNAYKRFVDKHGFPGAHGAMADARACMAVLDAQIEEFQLQGIAWKDLDPEQAKWLGPSEHLIWNEEGILIVNFGKSKGIPAHQVQRSYWRWVVKVADFPEHVRIVAHHMAFVAMPGLNGPDLALWIKMRFA